MATRFSLLSRYILPLFLLAVLVPACSDEPEVVKDSTMKEEPTGVPGMPDNLNLVCGDMRVAADPTMVPMQLHVDDDSYTVRAEPTPTGVKFVGTGLTLTMQGDEMFLILDGENFDCTPAGYAP
ncbi:MAG: hypothetical protein ACOCWR_02110 [Oceanidesulfovibrio sp.]